MHTECLRVSPLVRRVHPRESLRIVTASRPLFWFAKHSSSSFGDKIYLSGSGNGNRSEVNSVPYPQVDENGNYNVRRELTVSCQYS